MSDITTKVKMVRVSDYRVTYEKFKSSPRSPADYEVALKQIGELYGPNEHPNDPSKTNDEALQTHDEKIRASANKDWDTVVVQRIDNEIAKDRQAIVDEQWKIDHWPRYPNDLYRKQQLDTIDQKNRDIRVLQWQRQSQ